MAHMWSLHAHNKLGSKKNKNAAQLFLRAQIITRLSKEYYITWLEGTLGEIGGDGTTRECRQISAQL